MTLKLQHPFTLKWLLFPAVVGVSTFDITLLECRGQHCDIVFRNMVLCHNENNAPHHLKNVSFLKGVRGFENPENVPTLLVLDDFMDTAYSSKVS